MSSERLEVLEVLAARIAKVTLKHPLRIAVDGRDGSGKTRLADALAERVRAHGLPVIRASIDAFHRPKAERYARGRYSAEGCYYDSRDLPAFMNLLLVPLGPRGSRLYRTAVFDLERDAPVAQEPMRAHDGAAAIIDGTFLQRPELRDFFDVTIFVQTSASIAAKRGIDRDAGSLGGVEMARKLYRERYGGAFELYESLCAPEEIADVVLNNDNFEQPALLIREGSLLAEPEPR